MNIRNLITREQFFEFIKTKGETSDRASRSTQHYLKYFDNYKATGKKGNYNWGSFFYTTWSFYRRMYFAGFASMAILYFVHFVGDFFKNRLYVNLFRSEIDGGYFNFMACYNKYRDSIEICFALGVIFIWTKYGDYIYLRFANLKIAKGIKNKEPRLFCGVVVGLFFYILIHIAFEVIKFFALKPFCLDMMCPN